MNERDAEIAKIQTALWMAEKLARLCREILRARDAEADADISRLADEIDAFTGSQSFREAVAAVGAEYFYPDKLRIMQTLLRQNRAGTIAEAARMLEGLQGGVSGF